MGPLSGSCRNSPKESTNTTPFRLTYGHDAVLPVEIHLQSVRVQKQMDIPIDHYWKMMSDELVDLDEERLRANVSSGDKGLMLRVYFLE